MEKSRWLTLMLLLFLPTHGLPGPNSPLGTNLAEIVDWSTDPPFIDLFKISRPWITQNQFQWDTGESDLLDLDADGWVRSLPTADSSRRFTSVGTLIFREMGDRYPAGQYIVLYDGDGVIEYGFAARKNSSLSTPGRDVIEVTPGDNGIYLKITATDPSQTGNYIRNIRVYSPGTENSVSVFRSDFVDRLKPYRALRYIHWMRTQDTPVANWAERPRKTNARYSTTLGAPLEIMTELANQSSTEPWFHIPHTASDEYVRQFAAQVARDLDPVLNLYVEYTNEFWNDDYRFPQGRWIQSQAEREWPDPTISGYTKRVNWYGKRTAEICRIFKSVFADDASRVVCIMGGQGANAWVGDQALKCPLWVAGPCTDYGIDALAIGPYFGAYLGLAQNRDEIGGWIAQPDGGLSSLFQELEFGGLLTQGAPGGAIEQSRRWMTSNKTIADSHQIALVAYEGGQHLVGSGGDINNQNLNALFLAANRDARMGQLYQLYLDTWKSVGGQLFNHFLHIDRPGPWGYWGSLEFAGQASAAKHDALLSFIDMNSCWWPDCQSDTDVTSVAIYAAGATGDEQMQLRFNGEVISTWTVGGNPSEREFQRFETTVAGVVRPEQVQVAFINDAYTPGVLDRNLHVDKISINGVEYQSESDTVSSTGSWAADSGCAPGNKSTELLACNGYFNYAP